MNFIVYLFLSGQSGIRDVQAVTSPFLVLDIRRDHIVEDSLARLADRERDLKKPLKIRYVGGGEQVCLSCFRGTF